MYNITVFATILHSLDTWIIKENEELRAADLRPYKACTIRLIGQAALLESDLDIPLVATADVDVYADYEHPVLLQFALLLKRNNLIVDPLGHEAWMPKETTYECCYQGRYVTGLIAHPDFILIARAPAKNRVLLTDYLALGVSERFMQLAEKYKVDLEQFV